ncbi:MAG: hypothetical protein LBI03_04710 [Clostridiales bacterium]|jgi:hypothetical protein|nr:hypothetical protein [Clostridiales bacterium]
MESFVMHELRKEVDQKYVGFRPESGSVKPVHIATGVFRAILGQSFTAEGIKKLSYVIGAKGKTPKGNEPDKVIEYLTKHKSIDITEINTKQIESFRFMLQKLVDVDKGVYGIDDSMLAYTAGASQFVTSKGIHEDAGEFIGGLIKEYCPSLSKHIAEILKNNNDAISFIFIPVLDKGDFDSIGTIPLHKEVIAFEKPNKALKKYVSSLQDAGECLKTQLENHPNKLTQLRLFILFCVYELIRYMSLLEAFYCDGSFRPILLDFTSGKKGSISQTSGLCYSQLHKAISRFYAWGFAQELNTIGWSKIDLLKVDVPLYENKKQLNAKTREELKSMWDIAKANIKPMTDEDARLEVGMAINDMIAIVATAHPVSYMRKLGTDIGLLYPPTNFHTDKRFILDDDILETLLRCCIKPNETVASSELRNRLYSRLGIVVGGTEEDTTHLKNIGSIVYADTDALANNFVLFADALQRMNFAEQLTDGIMQIRFGGNK